MWVNLGALGLAGFVGILIWFYRTGLSSITYHLSPYLLASMTALLVMGLVDSPYIKNDLGMFFWLLPALMIVSTNKNSGLTNA
jgi:hypothetical protein